MGALGRNLARILAMQRFAGGAGKDLHKDGGREAGDAYESHISLQAALQQAGLPLLFICSALRVPLLFSRCPPGPLATVHTSLGMARFGRVR